jgi:hypothetical protein
MPLHDTWGLPKPSWALDDEVLHGIVTTLWAHCVSVECGRMQFTVGSVHCVSDLCVFQGTVFQSTVCFSSLCFSPLCFSPLCLGNVHQQHFQMVQQVVQHIVQQRAMPPRHAAQHTASLLRGPLLAL